MRKLKGRLRPPSPAMLVAVIALVLAMGGTGFAAKKLLKLGSLSNGAKNKTVGVGKLTYVTGTSTQHNAGAQPQPVSAACPPGTTPLSGGVKVVSDNGNVKSLQVDGYTTASGYTAHIAVFTNAVTATPYVTCGISRAITGQLPAN